MPEHIDPLSLHPHERRSPDPPVEADGKHGKQKAQRWRDAWNQREPIDPIAQARREMEARGGAAHCACNLPATDHEAIYRSCQSNAATGREAARRRGANDYQFARANGWRPDVAGWTPPAGTTVPGWTIRALPVDVDPGGLRVEIYHDGCGHNAKVLREAVAEKTAQHERQRHGG